MLSCCGENVCAFLQSVYFSYEFTNLCIKPCTLWYILISFSWRILYFSIFILQCPLMVHNIVFTIEHEIIYMFDIVCPIKLFFLIQTTFVTCHAVTDIWLPLGMPCVLYINGILCLHKYMNYKAFVTLRYTSSPRVIWARFALHDSKPLAFMQLLSCFQSGSFIFQNIQGTQN